MLRNKLRWLFRGEDPDIELRQLHDEGADTEGLEVIAGEIARMSDGPEKESAANAFYSRLEHAQWVKDYPYYEPDTLALIRDERQAEEITLEAVPDSDILKDRIKGAWIGRCAGCLLGIPVETWPRDKINGFLADTGNLPVKRYMGSDVDETIRKKYQLADLDLNEPYGRKTVCWINNVENFPVDDDINYSVLALKVLEQYGSGFTPEDMAAAWVSSFPALHACTAERVAYRNILNGIFPPYSASFRNPYREWIGAQIRGDVFGYVNPGNPAKAAELAFRDACVSHVKNGVYGEMWVSAMLAAACCCRDAETVVRAGMGQIPKQSRIYRQLGGVLEMWKKGAAFETVIGGIHGSFCENDWHDWCHVIPNASIVCASLLYGGSDFEKSVGLAVTSGFDTDCNGATVGSITGMMTGAAGIPQYWSVPVKGRISSTIDGYYSLSINDLAERIACIAEKNCNF